MSDGNFTPLRCSSGNTKLAAGLGEKRIDDAHRTRSLNFNVATDGCSFCINKGGLNIILLSVQGDGTACTDGGMSIDRPGGETRERA